MPFGNIRFYLKGECIAFHMNDEMPRKIDAGKAFNTISLKQHSTAMVNKGLDNKFLKVIHPRTYCLFMG